MANKLVLLIGMTETGKSTVFCSIAEALKHRSLIIDPGASPAYSNHGYIRVDQIPDFRDTSEGKIKRVSDVGDANRLMAYIFGVREDNRVYYDQAFMNGNLFLEDAGGYIDSNLSRNLKGRLKSFRMYGLNIFLSYHNFSEISSDVLGLGPHTLLLKKTAERIPVFSKIPKAMTLCARIRPAAVKAYYSLQCAGLSAKEITATYGPYLRDMARDLDFKGVNIAGHLSKLGRGKDPQYETIEIRLR